MIEEESWRAQDGSSSKQRPLPVRCSALLASRKSVLSSPRNHAPWVRRPSRFPRKSVSALSFLSCERSSAFDCIEVRFQSPIEVERFGLRKSTTIHAAPVIAKFCALPAQLIILCGSAKGAGSHTSSPKPTSIAVSNRDARSAERPESRAMAASANAIVVAIAQNICPGGIHFGTKAAVPDR